MSWQRRLITDMVDLPVHGDLKKTEATFSWFYYRF